LKGNKLVCITPFTHHFGKVLIGIERKEKSGWLEKGEDRWERGMITKTRGKKGKKVYFTGVAQARTCLCKEDSSM
jgi:hypothetical protein